MYTELLALRYKNKLPNLKFLPELRFKSNKKQRLLGKKISQLVKLLNLDILQSFTATFSLMQKQKKRGREEKGVE